MARLRGTKWQADARASGHGRRSFDTRAEAEAWERNPTVAKPVVTVEDVFRRGYNEFYRSEKNHRNSYRIVEELIAYLPGDVEQWNTRAVHDFKADQLAKGLNKKTVNRKIATLSRLLKYAVEEGSLSSLPTMKFYKEGPGRIRYLTPVEEATIFESLTPKHKDFATFLLYSGCRIGDALKLLWRDCHSGKVTFWDGKGGDARSVPLPLRAINALPLVASSGLVWGHIRYNDFHDDWAQARMLAGLDTDPFVVPHVLRHTCASRLVQAGIDIRRVKEWMGHKSITTTMLYANLAPNDLDKAAAALDGSGSVVPYSVPSVSAVA